jgi:hypothetical protein
MGLMVLNNFCGFPVRHEQTLADGWEGVKDPQTTTDGNYTLTQLYVPSISQNNHSMASCA